MKLHQSGFGEDLIILKERKQQKEKLGKPRVCSHADFCNAFTIANKQNYCCAREPCGLYSITTEGSNRQQSSLAWQRECLTFPVNKGAVRGRPGIIRERLSHIPASSGWERAGWESLWETWMLNELRMLNELSPAPVDSARPDVKNSPKPKNFP